MINGVNGQPWQVAGSGLELRKNLLEETKDKADALTSMVPQHDTVEINESIHLEYLHVSSMETFDREAKGAIKESLSDILDKIEDLVDKARDLLEGTEEASSPGLALGNPFGNEIPGLSPGNPFGNESPGLSLGNVPKDGFQGASYEKVEFSLEYKFEATYSRNSTNNLQNNKGIGQKKLDELKEYFSPENTSQRIVDFATSFFSLYLQNHENEEGGTEDKLNDFMELVKGAIDKGFERAREILENMPKPVEEQMNETYDMVQLKLDSWKEEQLELMSPENFVDMGQDTAAGEVPLLEEMTAVPEMEFTGISQAAAVEETPQPAAGEGPAV